MAETSGTPVKDEDREQAPAKSRLSSILITCRSDSRELGIISTSQGEISAGTADEIVGLNDALQKDVVTQVESFKTVLDVALAGENIGCLLRKTGHDEVRRGQILVLAGSVAPRRNFDAEVYVLKKEEGGRHTPFVSGYTPQFFFRTTDVTGAITVLGDADMAIPGEGVNGRFPDKSTIRSFGLSQLSFRASPSRRPDHHSPFRRNVQLSTWSSPTTFSTFDSILSNSSVVIARPFALPELVPFGIRIAGHSISSF